MDALRNATLSADPAGLAAIARPLWDDLYMLVPCYSLAVATLLRVGPWSADKTKERTYVASGDWFWRPVMIAYNAAMTVFSLVCASTMAYVVFSRHGGEIKGAECARIGSDPLFRRVVYAFYVSKYVEFADTLFLIVKGKGVSNLHYYHHCGAAIVMGMLYHSATEATFIFVTFNGFIHTLMYAYYGLSLLGIRLPGKSHLTSLQITQFVVGLAWFFSYKDNACYQASPQMMLTYLVTFAYVLMVLLFFVNFYVSAYVAKTGKDIKLE